MEVVISELCGVGRGRAGGVYRNFPADIWFTLFMNSHKTYDLPKKEFARVSVNII